MSSLKEYFKTLFNSFLNNTETNKHIAIQYMPSIQMTQETIPVTSSTTSYFAYRVAPYDGFARIVWALNSSDDIHRRVLSDVYNNSSHVVYSLDFTSSANGDVKMTVPCKKGWNVSIINSTAICQASTITVQWIKSIGGA